jgi:hypothetical protein
MKSNGKINLLYLLIIRVEKEKNVNLKCLKMDLASEVLLHGNNKDKRARMFDSNCPISIPVKKFLSVSRQVQFKCPPCRRVPL